MSQLIVYKTRLFWYTEKQKEDVHLNLNGGWMDEISMDR